MHIHIGVALVRVGLWHADKTETNKHNVG